MIPVIISLRTHNNGQLVFFLSLFYSTFFYVITKMMIIRALFRFNEDYDDDDDDTIINARDKKKQNKNNKTFTGSSMLFGIDCVPSVERKIDHLMIILMIIRMLYYNSLTDTGIKFDFYYRSCLEKKFHFNFETHLTTWYNVLLLLLSFRFNFVFYRLSE